MNPNNHQHPNFAKRILHRGKKVLIWFFACSIPAAISALLHMQNGVVLGGLPTILLFGSSFALARVICKKLDEQYEAPTTINPEDNEPKIIEIEVSPTKKITLEPSSYHVDTASTTWVCPNCKRQNLTSRNSCWNCNTKVK